MFYTVTKSNFGDIIQNVAGKTENAIICGTFRVVHISISFTLRVMIYLGNLNYFLECTKSFLLQYINKIKFCFYNELLSLIKMNLMPGRMYYACPHNSESGGWNISSIWRIGGYSTYIDRYHAGTHWIPKKVKNDNPLTDSSGQKQTLHPCNIYQGSVHIK